MCILFVTFSPQILPSQFNSTISLWKFEIFSSYPGTGTVLCKFYIYFKYTKSYFFKDYNYLQTDSFILFTASKQFMKDLYCGDTNLSKTSSFFKILLTSLPLKFPPWNTSLSTSFFKGMQDIIHRAKINQMKGRRRQWTRTGSSARCSINGSNLQLKKFFNFFRSPPVCSLQFSLWFDILAKVLCSPLTHIPSGP